MPSAPNHVALLLCITTLAGFAQQPANTLNVKTDGSAAGDGMTDDAVAIRAVIHSAKMQGKHVYFPPGTYAIGSDIATTNGVSLLGDHAGLSIVASLPGTVQHVGNEAWSAPSGSIDVEDLVFANVQLDWYGSESARRYIDVRRCLFIGADPAFSNTVDVSYFQINLGHTVDGVVEDCVFLRQSSSMGGSVYGYETIRQTYRRNVWGVHLDRAGWLATEWSGYSAWSNLLPKLVTLRSQFGLSADQGHFRRGIKINGCTDSLVERNIFNGSPYTSTFPVNRDHVIYAHGGHTGLKVLANWMRGWPSAPNGGLKIRNTFGPTTVIANHLVNTPLLQYAYDNNIPIAYENTIVHRNHFDLYQNFSDSRLGISWWKNFSGYASQTNNEYSANVFECPKAYATCINLTNGDVPGHKAYGSNVFLSDGTPVSIADPFVLVPGAPDSARTAPYEGYAIPILDIPTFTTDPLFATSIIDIGAVAVEQPVSGSVAGMAYDADGEALEFMKMDGPDWLAVNLDGSFSGTPHAADAGINEFTLRASDNHDGYGSATLRIMVGAETLTLFPVQDTHVVQGAPDSNYGSNALLALRSGKYTNAMNGYIMFDVDVGNLAIVSAKLKLYCTRQSFNMTIRDVADTSWTEATLTWNNRPAMGTNSLTQAVGTNLWEAFDVSGFVVRNGLVGFGLTSDLASYANVDAKEGSHPPVLEIVVATDANDWDDDGLPNAWELAYFGGETNAAPSGHGDTDGFDNLAEYIAGTDPTNSDSFFAISSSMCPAGFVVSWPAVPDRAYGILHADALTNGFTRLSDGIPSPQSSFTNAVGGAGYYRVDVRLP